MSTSQSKGPGSPPSAASVPSQSAVPVIDAAQPAAATATRPRELGGVAGPEPTRFGDWEKNGRCIDF